MTSIAHSDLPYDPTAPLTPTGNLRRRVMVSRLMQGGAIGAAVVAVAALAIVTFDVIKSGAQALSLGFLTHNVPQYGGPGGGILSELVGQAIIVAAGAVIAMPIGVLIAIYLEEFASARPPVSGALRMGLDILQGGINGFIGAVALVSGGDIYRRFGQRNAGFRPAYKFSR